MVVEVMMMIMMMRHSSPLVLLLLLLHLFSVTPPVYSLQYLRRGSYLSVEKPTDVLVSKNNVFSCGFHQAGTNAYSFSIWYTKSNDTLVWTASRDRPVHGRRSRAALWKDGTMVLLDADDSIVWSTNTTSTTVDRAELLDEGNLVLKDPTGKLLWQSFAFPTDTLLPGQPITKDLKLVSARYEGSTNSGFHILYYDNDNVLKMTYDGPDISSIYWPTADFNVFAAGRTTYNSSRYGVLDETGQFVSSDRFYFASSDMNTSGSIKRRLTIGVDGNLRLYSLNETTGRWVVTWQAAEEPCSIHGLCGRNGICTYTPKPMCSCPPSYALVDPRDWKKGCKPKFREMTCGKAYDEREWKFITIPHADFYGYDTNYTTGVSLENCRDICQKDCTCVAFGYREIADGACFPKAALFNGYATPNFVGSLHLKVPSTSGTVNTLNVGKPNCEKNSNTNSSMISSESSYYHLEIRSGEIKWTYGYIFVSAFGIIELLFIGIGWWFLFGGRNQTTQEKGYQMITDNFRKFSYKELRKATGDFKEELGRGGSGEVYKGVLNDKREIGVKRLVDASRGEEEFRAELSVIGRIYHMNLVRMWGFCLEHSHRLLVYEFIENGSLDKALFNAGILSWAKRFRIAFGTAKGLAYLHHECLDWIIHCDIKPENILLDANYNPKIADFGLVKLTQRDGPDSTLSRIRGTNGYMAPEWMSNVPITSKVDVYSYGIVLLELVKGRRAASWAPGDGEFVGIRRVVRELQRTMAEEDASWVEDFVDPTLNGDFNRMQAEVMLGLAVSCLEEERNKRPTMDVVVETLLSCDAPVNPFQYN